MTDPGLAAVAHVGPRPALPDEIAQTGVLAIGRALDRSRVLSIATALIEGGVRAFEITLDSDGALGSIDALARTFGESGQLMTGAGTVLDIDAAQAALDAGASFLVTPHLDVELVAFASSRGVPIIPGAFSPTEILAAWRAGAAAVKLFPASVAGAAFVREFGGPFPDIPLVATGGVSVENAGSFIAAGAVAVGMGSWLTRSGDPVVVAARAREAIDVVRRSRRTTAA
jgi:2-dehydro-3-deoxyphosphogluconate aldolase/(4S)-4-hydroxy-2-oxoglutarate aldolase